jgi:putative hydrolase of HD superfamily
VVEGLGDHLAFLIEVDRLKRVDRQSRLVGGGRRENSAEHSWHLALFALSLGRDRPIDMLKAVKMLLIHDLVEIDAGDTPLHGNSLSKEEQIAAETAAARRIFGLLPPEPQAEYFTLWEEFEAGESAEARFARAIDRLQPLISNLLNEGGTWTENKVSEEMVIERYGHPISAAFPDLWPEIRAWVGWHFGKPPTDFIQ